MRRFDKSYAEAKRKIDNGDIGKVVLVRSYTQDPRSTIESTLKFAPHSGGQYLDMCVHDIDLTAGSPAPTSRTSGRLAAYSSSTCTRS